MVFDLRNEETKMIINEHRETKSFKQEFEIWQERPQLIKSELVE